MNTRPANLLLAFIAIAGIALAAAYSYRCPKCGLIQQYDRMGIYKCPSDGGAMVPK